MDTYFEQLNELIGAAKADIEAGRYGISAAIQPEIAIAMYGDMDAVFSSFKRETGASYMHIEPKKLAKLYKKLEKSIAKMKKAKYVYEAQKCFSSDERMAPCVSYEFAMYYLCNGSPESYIPNMETAAASGDPRAITYCQNYYSTNSEEANPYAGASYAQNIKLNGKFDFNKMFYYAILGIGFDYSPYYPDRYTVIPNTFSGADAEGKRKEALEKLYETLAYFVLPENMESEDYQKHFGDFVPSELQVKIARKWFFVEDDRFIIPDGMHRYIAEMREKITAAVQAETSPKVAPKTKKETAKPKTLKTADKKTTKTVDTAFGTVTVPAEAAANVPEAKKKSETKKKSEAKKPAEKKSTAPAAPKTEYKRIEMSSGDVYEGGYANGEYHGQGTYTSRKGWVYVGAFDNGVMTDGKLTFTESGHVFEGHFENGALHGKGKATYYVKENGKYVYDGTYEGDWVKGKCHGKGKRVYHNGNVYDGDWVDDKRDGYGKFERYTDKLQTKHFRDLVYEGQWNGDKKHGKGVEKHYIPGVNEDVTVYEGEWVNGKREGIFVWYLFYPATGKESSKDMQYYQNGEIVIESIPYDASIKTYEDFAAAKAKLDAAAEERKRSEAARTASTAQEPSDADEEFWEKFDDPEKLREKWENPNLFLDSRDALIINSSEYFGQFYSLIDQCCKESDFEAANEILGALVGLTAQELFDYYNATCMRVYGKIKQLVPSYASASLIDNAIDAAISHTRSISIAGVINIAFYLYKEIGRSDTLENALQIYAPAGSKMSNTDADGMASLWFRRYIVNDGDVEKNIFGVNPDHTPYELWGNDLDNALSSGNTMLANGYIGPNPTIRDDDEDSYSEDYSDQYVEDDYIKYSDGSVYQGPTKNGVPHGEGKLHYASGAKYDGGFSYGKFSGFGQMDYADGSVYMGWWSNGKRHGIGQYCSSNADRIFYGLYKDGERCGMGAEYRDNGWRYGNWDGNYCYGSDEYTLHNHPNMLIKGSMKRTGTCSVTILHMNGGGDNSMYVGEMWCRTYNGIGTYYSWDGYKIKCRWLENKVEEILEVRNPNDEVVPKLFFEDGFEYDVFPK